MQHERPRPKEEDIQRIVQKHADASGLMGVLQEIQAKYLHLPEEALRTVAELTGRSLVDVYGAATFYNAFSLKPRGKHLVSVCQGTACHVRGAQPVAVEVEKRLGAKPGGTTEDQEFTFETVNCLGACALGPVVVVDGRYHPNVSTAAVERILDGAANEEASIEPTSDPRIFPLAVACPNCNHSLLDRSHTIDGHPSIHVTASFGERHGWVRLSSLYGSYAIESKHEIPFDVVVNFFCPHCHGELVGAFRCIECDSPMVPMMLRGGGTLQVCTRRGCKGHILNLGVTPVE